MKTPGGSAAARLGRRAASSLATAEPLSENRRDMFCTDEEEAAAAAAGRGGRWERSAVAASIGGHSNRASLSAVLADHSVWYASVAAPVAAAAPATPVKASFRSIQGDGCAQLHTARVSWPELAEDKPGHTCARALRGRPPPTNEPRAVGIFKIRKWGARIGMFF